MSDKLRAQHTICEDCGKEILHDKANWADDGSSYCPSCRTLEPLHTRAALSAPQADVAAAWPNGCDKTVPAALRYLAEHDKPSGGQSLYNSEHLLQLADEIERAVAAPPSQSAQMREALDAIAHAEQMLSEHVEKYHDFDYEPHNVPAELASLRGIQHHLLGSLIDANGQALSRADDGNEPTIGGTAFCGHGVMASICDKCADDGKESDGGIMDAARRAQQRVDSWSDAKKDYAERAMKSEGGALPTNLAEIIETELTAWRGTNGGVYTIHAAALGISCAIRSAVFRASNMESEGCKLWAVKGLLPTRELVELRDALKSVLSLFDDEGNLSCSFTELQSAVLDGYETLGRTKPSYELTKSEGGHESGVAAVSCEIPTQRSGESCDPLGDGSVNTSPHREDAAGVAPGPSDPIPPDQREAIARIIKCCCCVRVQGEYHAPADGIYEAADRILALQPRAGG